MDKPFWNESIETLPRDQLRALQWERLRWQVERIIRQQ